MGLACHVMEPSKLAWWFWRFGTEVVGEDSPLYAQVCRLVAESPPLLALAARAAEETPMIFLAAIHDELLREPDDELAAYYPTVGGRRAPDAALGPALERFCAAREEPLAHTLATRRTQTNETARCAGLLPAFAAVASGRPLAQIEIGASAGLNGLWDHYAYDYAGTPAGDPDSPLRIACELRGERRAAARAAAGRVARGHRPRARSTCATPTTCAGCARACGPTSARATSASTPRSRSRGCTGRSTSAAATRWRCCPGVIESAPAGALLVRVPHRGARLLHARADRRAWRRCSPRSSAMSPGSAARRRASSSTTLARPARRCTSRSRRGGRAGSRRSPAWATTAAGSSGGARGTCARSGRGRCRSRSGERVK